MQTNLIEDLESPKTIAMKSELDDAIDEFVRKLIHISMEYKIDPNNVILYAVGRIPLVFDMYSMTAILSDKEMSPDEILHIIENLDLPPTLTMKLTLFLTALRSDVKTAINDKDREVM